jgi:hypothetical protein
LLQSIPTDNSRKNENKQTSRIVIWRRGNDHRCNAVKPDRIGIVDGSGSVSRYDMKARKGQYLFSVKSEIGFSDGGFDINAKSTIYTLDTIVVVVNDYKRHGFIHYPGKYHSVHLWRGDYHADISCYPIALFKNAEGVPHIMYGVDWNHLQIMNLDTLQILTASKSLIEENAEERHIEFYKNFRENNKSPWPREYDYFYGKLYLSPAARHFLSAGWAWGSCDAYNAYDIEHFISSNRIAGIAIGAWEHENRAVCWIDDQTVAVAYHPFTEGDEDATVASPAEIHLYTIVAGRAEMAKKIQTGDLNVLPANMIYDRRFNAIVAFSDKMGLVMISMHGRILFHDDHLKIEEYSVETGLLVITENKAISVYEINE